MNPKRQRFCQEYIIDSNCTQAAIRAGYSEKTAHAQGSRLLKDVEVRERIDELRAEHSKRLEITVDSLTQFLLDDRTLAHDNKQAGAAVSATEKLGKLHGLIGDKLDIHLHITPADMSDEEIDAEIEQNHREFIELAIRSNGRAGLVARIAKCQDDLARFDRGEFDDLTPAPLALPAPVTPPPE